MVFKRRNPRTLLGWAREMVYPSGGFMRAIQYVLHRMRRLPDEPHRIARGVFAGVFVSFTPLFGLHFMAAALMAWIMRGNILAALLATFVGNPATFPLIAILSIELGHSLLGIEARLTPVAVLNAFTRAGSEIWFNLGALFTDDVTRWDNLAVFFQSIFLPYLVGGILPGIVVALAFYYGTIPIVRAYQKIRSSKARERSEKRRRLKEALAHAAAKIARPDTATAGDDDRPGTP